MNCAMSSEMIQLLPSEIFSGGWDDKMYVYDPIIEQRQRIFGEVGTFIGFPEER